MTTDIRTRAAFLLLLAALGGCSTVLPVAATAVSTAASATASVATFTAKRIAGAIRPAPKTTAPVAPPSPMLDAYKAEVAQHVMRRNSEQTFSGRLPPMLPAIVVLTITVDEDGELSDVEVQRSRDDDASKVALASMRRSGPLPKPANLLAGNMRKLTFSETFLFDHQYRFQLRSLAGPQ